MVKLRSIRRGTNHSAAISGAVADNLKRRRLPRLYRKMSHEEKDWPELVK